MARARASAAPLHGSITTFASNVPGLNRWKYCAVNGIDPSHAANEVAVHAFARGDIRFGDVVPLVETIMNQMPPTAEVNLEDLFAADAWARRQAAAHVASAPAEAKPAKRSGD